MKFKENIKNYFLSKPKNNIWKDGFFLLLFIRLLAPTSLMFLFIFQMGLMSPNVESSNIGPVINQATKEVTESIFQPMLSMFENGQEMARESPIVAKIMYYGISALIWSIFASAIMFLINGCRHIIYYIHKRIQKHRGIIDEN